MFSQVLQLLLIGALIGDCIGTIIGVWIGSVLARNNYAHHLELQYKHRASLNDERPAPKKPRRVYYYDEPEPR